MAIDAAALTDIRNYIKRRIGYLRYRVGNTYYKSPISDTQILANGTVRIQATIVPSIPTTINRVELFNNAGELWAHQDISISINQSQTGVLYWFDFTVEEGEKNV